MPPESLVHGPLMQTTASRKKKKWVEEHSRTNIHTYTRHRKKQQLNDPLFFVISSEREK